MNKLLRTCILIPIISFCLPVLAQQPHYKNSKQLAFWKADMRYEAEPGSFEIMVGKSSVDFQKINLEVTE